MKSYFDTIILSPHLDDAALSCGGLIHTLSEKGKAVLVVTFMAGEPPQIPFSHFANQLHDRWELASQIVQQRREEDRNACHILGADFLHGAIPDAIYRNELLSEHNYFYTSDETLFGQIHPVDAKITLPQIATIINDLPKHDHLIAPLTIGSHVDHQLVRTAVEQCYNKLVSYYEDYPYARQAGAVEAVIANDRLQLEYETISLSLENLKFKGASIAAFKSQISSFFNGRLDIETQISAYASKIGGERYWAQKSI